MCGIVGIAGDISYQARQLFRDFLDVAQTRGRDSTGVIKVKKNQDYDWVKQVGPPAYLCDSRAYEKRIEVGDALALIGHCRAKTVGEVSVKNAHPFDFPEKGICGVHNGTLRNERDLDTYEHSKVDSEVLYGHLAEHGPAETFNKTKGAWACVWWNNEEKTLNFIRNKDRPLWFTWSKDNKMMFWASEIWMFSAIARKIALAEPGEDGKSPYFELPTNKLWQFKFNPSAKLNEPVMIFKTPVDIEEWKAPVVERVGWTQSDNGTWTRDGGEVANPFGFNGRGRYLGEDLDDDLPWEAYSYRGPRHGQTDPHPIITPPVAALPAPTHQLPANPDGTPAERKSSPISNVSFLTHSAQPTASETVSTSMKRKVRDLLSLPVTNLNHSGSSNKGKGCVGLGRPSQSPRLQISGGVSHRTVSGLRYITDNSTKSEYLEKEFIENTGGKCSFCKTTVKALDKVGLILNKNSFICTDCLVEPKSAVA